MEDLELHFKFYPSNNSWGHNALVQVREKDGEKHLVRASVFLSFDQTPPRFLWHESSFSFGEEEYLELRIQNEAEKMLTKLVLVAKDKS